MSKQAATQALAHGQQQGIDVGACGNPGFGGMGWYGGYGLGGCPPMSITNPGVQPAFPGYVPPGVVMSSKTLGAEGLLGIDGRIFRFVAGTSAFVQSNALTVDINGVAIDLGNFQGFIYTVEEIGTNGELRVTIDEGFATVCGWKWTDTDRITIVRAAAQKDLVDKVLNTPADAFNVDGCACPIAFVCITEDDALELDLSLTGDCAVADEVCIVNIQGEDPVGQAVAFGLDAAKFAFTLYLNVYETVGTCGVVSPLYNLAPCAVPPGAPGCPPGALPPGNGYGTSPVPSNGGGGIPGGTYLNPGAYMGVR